ncbi:MAG: hypothetical protein ACJ8G3_05630 [Burkholderiaceae bacterium]
MMNYIEGTTTRTGLPVKAVPERGVMSSVIASPVKKCAPCILSRMLFAWHETIRLIRTQKTRDKLINLFVARP